MSYSLGVDLGTTFVAAAVAHPNQIETFTLGDPAQVAHPCPRPGSPDTWEV